MLDDAELQALKIELMELTTLDPLDHEIVFELYSGSSVIRVTIRNRNEVHKKVATINFNTFRTLTSTHTHVDLAALSIQTQKARQQTQEKIEALGRAENQALDLVAHFSANPDLISKMPVKVEPRKAAPVVPYDSCAGITCSGHGSCEEGHNGQALCQCYPGWFRRDCGAVPLRLSSLQNISECGGGVSASLLARDIGVHLQQHNVHRKACPQIGSSLNRTQGKNLLCHSVLVFNLCNARTQCSRRAEVQNWS